MTRARLRWLWNFAGFQAGWFACVLGAAHGVPWLGPGCAAALLIVHLGLTERRAREALGVAAAAAVGCLFDAALVGLGALRFAADQPHLGPLPVWIVALWLLFGSTLNSSLAWLQRRPWLAAAAGAACGPLCYRAGVALGGTALPLDRVAAFLWLAFAWAQAVPLAAWLVRRVHQRTSTAPT